MSRAATLVVDMASPTKEPKEVEGAYDEVSTLLRDHRDQLDALAQLLIEHETLDEVDAYAAAGIERREDDMPEHLTPPLPAQR